LQVINDGYLQVETKGEIMETITKEQLENLYIEQGLTVRQCAEALGLPTHGGISWRLRKFGINARPQLQVDRFNGGAKPRPICKQTVRCDVCGKSMKRFPSQIHDKNFCSDACYGKWRSENFQGEANPNYGNLALVGPANPNWKGGITFEEYCAVWKDRDFKREIKERDGFKCQNPDCRKNSDILNIHHIDYDKKNCHPKNLITVCRSCNSRANKDRQWHKAWYKVIMYRRYGYE